MKHLFIPYEQALELKQLGFDEICAGYYDEPNLICYTQVKQSNLINGEIAAPLYQQAFRFFRKKYELTIHIYLYQDTRLWNFDIYDDVPEDIDLGNEDYDTYEQAEHACLLKLIELAKQK